MPSDHPSQAEPGSEAGTRPAARGPAAPSAALGVALGAAFRVIAVGASAGGLEACTKLLDALPTPTGMAFILVQHLDPTHNSLLVDLLAEHTALAVVQAADGMPVEPEHVYVIPPGAYLSVEAGILRLSAPEMRDGAPHGARLPFDALLHSLARQYGPRVACVVLSGTGSDGSAGLRAVKEAGGLVIAQDLDEADYDGMPRSAVATGLVDAVLPLAGIPGALAAAPANPGPPAPPPAAGPQPGAADGPDPHKTIIELLHARIGHDFAPYKRSTLERRIERRMGLASLAGDPGRYLDKLRGDRGELELLAKDLLIHVTGFFRDPAVFDALARQVTPGLLRDRAPGDPVRVWVAGCSTGEEAYSLAILLHEAIAAAQKRQGKPDIKLLDFKLPDLKLQVFASDIDADAVAVARAGLYPPSITANVSADRLARFFTKEDGHGYRVHPDLRASVVFTVQDLLTDPPFSRLDLVSCRNVMIYFDPDAQARALALFHFALKKGGTLLLGSAEGAGDKDGRFEPVDKAARLYRHVGRKRPGDLAFAATATDGPPLMARRTDQTAAPSRQAVLAELCRQAVLDAHAPAAVLCNARHECLYSLGPTNHFLHVAPGQATAKLLAMVAGPLRTRLRLALARAAQGGARVTAPGGSTVRDGRMVPFGIDVQPLSSDGEALLLVCFTDSPAPAQDGGDAGAGAPRVAELEWELEAVRAELDSAHRTIEVSGEKQRAVNEEALSVNEEYQSINEELLTSKEELQSLNEELRALNSQLQETLERQRTTANDLQNILYSADMATLFLDRDMNIRFFTPATRALFSIIPGDVGRPLADLRSLAADVALPADARAVLQSLQPAEREVETADGAWFRRRILPYRTEGQRVEGVVITFNDITRRRQEAAALNEAKQAAESANRAKSRFLAAASHDLRQPLQTLALLQGVLERTVRGKAAGLVQRLDDTLGAMTGMLDALLDLNQIEAGVVQAEVAEFRIGPLLDQLRDEFGYGAQAKGLALRVVPCGALVRTDPQLLEQMLRNLLSNALKYTEHGRVLLGCRRMGDNLRIEVWDTGIGIPDGELQAVFDEYHQVGNEARERARGLGLGLSIVQRLGALLGHCVRVRSRPGKGSVFTVDVALEPAAWLPGAGAGRQAATQFTPAGSAGSHAGTILVIEDDPDMRDLLQLLLRGEGHTVLAASTGPAALDIAVRGAVAPTLVLADYNLPGGMTGLQAALGLRETFPGVPAIILTGDISAGKMRDVMQAGCRQLNKPVKPRDLLRLVGEMLPAVACPLAPPPAEAASRSEAGAAAPVVFVVDDDSNIRAMLRAVLENDGHRVEDFGSGDAFLAAFRPDREGCLVVDAAMPGLGGLDVLQRLNAAGHRLPAIVVTGHGDVAMAVDAMKAGAVDFIEKPMSMPDLLAGVGRALDQARDAGARATRHAVAARSIAALTPRQRDVMAMMLAGHPSKNIATDLGISQRTVENHRASIMHKTGARSMPALARLALAAVDGEAGALANPAGSYWVPGW